MSRLLNESFCSRPASVTSLEDMLKLLALGALFLVCEMLVVADLSTSKLDCLAYSTPGLLS